MNLLNQYAPSLERIYGTTQPELRESFQTLLLVLDGVAELIASGTPEQMEARLNMLRGSALRHFDLEMSHMFDNGYDSAAEHMNKHDRFVQMIEMFMLEFPYKDIPARFASFRLMQRWVTIHLLVDDAHYLSTLTAQS